MAVVTVGGAAFAHPGGSELFSDISFRVPTGGHVALVGPNGVGKSTIMRCIGGELRLTEGSATTDAPFVYMPQAIGTDATNTGPVEARSSTTVRELLVHFSPKNVRDAAVVLVTAERANDEHHTEATGIALGSAVVGWSEVGGYEAEARWDACCQKVLRQDLVDAADRPISQLSGGERKKLVLESLFASDVPILLIDEPDNFLDIPAKRWLEQKIIETTKTVLFISHDRELLSAAATAIVTLETNSCWTHPGNWTTYVEARRERNESLGDALDRWKDEERRLFRFYKIMKERAKVNDGNAGRANAAESRWKRFVEVGPPPPPPPARSVHMNLKGAGSGKIVVKCNGLELVGLTDPFDLEVHYGDRVGVLGPNGTGKSHFLRLLGGDETVLHDGTYKLGARVHEALFHQTDDVPEFRDRTPMAIIADFGMPEEQCLKALSRYGLAEAAKREVETLSGGQRARLQVLTLELSGVNLLLLDEPTDNLDIASSEALEAALDTFDGTVIAVTHDRWFMRGLDRWLILDDDGSVREALDLDSALHVITGDDRYEFTAARLVALNS